MNRYSQIPTTKIQLENSSPIVYKNVRYPKISLGDQDIYVYVTRGDRYDLLAQTYYGDSNLWWVINRANPSQDASSLLPTPGSQIRIPSPDRINVILSNYKLLNIDI
jgi:nucleoid-associated protein YgaU